MAETITTQTVATHSSGPTTPEAFIADRQIFWGRFTQFIVYSVVATVLVLIGLAVFVA